VASFFLENAGELRFALEREKGPHTTSLMRGTNMRDGSIKQTLAKKKTKHNQNLI
jgi:hypothetical protein